MLTRILFVVHFFGGLLFSVPVLSDVAISIGIYGKSETFNISSVITEDKHEISVYLPPGYHSKSEEKYPVLVLLDSNLLFGHARSAINLFAVGGTIKPPVLVGIGYLEDDFDTFMQIRSHYFASAVEKNGEGAKQFSLFIENELIPQLEHRYVIDAAQLTLSAAALSGIFGVYSLFADSPIFANYILSGPRIWANNGALFDVEAAYAQENDSLNARVYFTVGSLDKLDYVDSWQRFTSILEQRAYDGLTLEAELLENEDHFSAMLVTLTNGIRRIYGVSET